MLEPNSSAVNVDTLEIYEIIPKKKGADSDHLCTEGDPVLSPGNKCLGAELGPCSPEQLPSVVQEQKEIVTLGFAPEKGRTQVNLQSAFKTMISRFAYRFSNLQ